MAILNLKTKECIIENGQFNFILYVDGKEIMFDGYDNAEYFYNHYKELGYKMKKISTYRKELQDDK